MKLETVCRSGAHCRTCRDKDRVAWRESLARACGLSEIVCPMGHPWGHSPPVGLRLPIPADYDPRDYKRDSKGTDGCGCA